MKASTEPGWGVMLFTVAFTVVVGGVMLACIFRFAAGRWPWQQ